MSADRELLELAAKAAGIEIEFLQPSGKCFLKNAGAWNPLCLDDDAFRLAVDLSLNIEFRNDGNDYTVAWDGCIGSGKFYHHESDRRTATRRAIVTIAADVAKAEGGTEG